MSYSVNSRQSGQSSNSTHCIQSWRYKNESNRQYSNLIFIYGQDTDSSHLRPLESLPNHGKTSDAGDKSLRQRSEYYLFCRGLEYCRWNVGLEAQWEVLDQGIRRSQRSANPWTQMPSRCRSQPPNWNVYCWEVSSFEDGSYTVNWGFLSFRVLHMQVGCRPLRNWLITFTIAYGIIQWWTNPLPAVSKVRAPKFSIKLSTFGDPAVSYATGSKRCDCEIEAYF